uniref:Schlafen family member 11 n=1 Tax=Catagonus wagneri TaxID=51154 RepID=A0A8C3YEI8_9CETA
MPDPRATEQRKITLGEGNRKKLQKFQREQEKAKVIKAACALLNSGGGVIQLEMANDNKYPVEMGLDLEESLRTLIQSLNLQDFFMTKQEGKCYYIFVKSWSSDPFPEGISFKPRICSLSSSLYCRSGTSVLLMDSRQAFSFLKNKKMKAKTFGQEHPAKVVKAIRQDSCNSHFAYQFFQKDHLEYGEIVPFPESQVIEFKQFSTKHIQEYVKNIIPEYVSAFANAEGGILFIGVEDKTKKVLGCAKEKVDCDSLKKKIENTLYKLPCVHFCQSQCQIDFTVKILDVLAKGELCGYACVIEVKPFCGAVFSEAPKSWIVKDKLICSLATQDWVNMMLDTDPGKMEKTPSLGPPLSRPVYSKKGLEHKKALQQKLFPVLPGHLKYTPKSLWRELSSQNEGLEELIDKEIFPFSQGILIFSRSWAVDLSLKEKQAVICDALLVTENSPPILYTILREQDADERSYCTHIALTLKQKLVNMGGYTGYLCVMAKILHLSPESNSEFLEDSGSWIDYPSSYYLANIQQMEALLQSLVIVLLGFRSFLSDQLGCEVLNLLTVQQYQIFSNNLRNYRELFIHGLPGSGKTVLAIKIMEKIRNEFHCEADEILYICENQPLKNFISNKKICRAVTRKTFMKSDFQKIQHIVIDEAQNFRTEDGDWYEKAKTITQRDKDCPGILWIFLDYFQTNHMESSGLPALSAQYPRKRLTKVVRNADQIAEYLKKELQEVIKNPPPNIPRGSLQMLLEAEWDQGVLGTLNVKKNLTSSQIVTYVTDECKLLFEKGYSSKDVAVLVSTMSDMDFYRLELLRAMRKKIRVVQFADANDMSGDHIVLDSVRRFSGLERNIVFGIHPKTVDSALLHTILVCLVSRANQQLHILWH